jgi:hypothetical protein
MLPASAVSEGGTTSAVLGLAAGIVPIGRQGDGAIAAGVDIRIAGHLLFGNAPARRRSERGEDECAYESNGLHAISVAGP